MGKVGRQRLDVLCEKARVLRLAGHCVPSSISPSHQFFSLIHLPLRPAGVPGMVAGMLRHLRSLRTMRRDKGWWVMSQCVQCKGREASACSSCPVDVRLCVLF